MATQLKTFSSDENSESRSNLQPIMARLGPDLPFAPRAYKCRCGGAVFFRNSQCLACKSPLGYDPYRGNLYALEGGSGAGPWKVADTSNESEYYRCANWNTPTSCNWLLPATAMEGNARQLCVSCRLNRTIPDLSIAENATLWNKIERAKRRLVSSLLALGLPVASRVDEDPQRGLAFDLLRSPAEGPRVMTGHDSGLITINIEEADDATREKMRQEMHEPYRTLVGHLRHEIGHYYWERLVAGSPILADFRQLFGDERQNYADALRRNYEQGPPPDWPEHYVSPYASTHPWEDWAETWAHYLHMSDTLGTALSFGMDTGRLALDITPFTREDLFRPQATGAVQFLSFLNAWTELTTVLNELSRSMGEVDFYPFVLPLNAVRKLHFIHLVISGLGEEVEGKPSLGAAS
jgi:hypothetical protein